VLDQGTKDILATVLRVQDLRDIGVTLHVYGFPPSELLTCVWVSDDSWQATSNVSAVTVGCPCYLLCRSNPGEYPENRRGP